MVSIHTPPRGRDEQPGVRSYNLTLFQSTRPRGGVTALADTPDNLWLSFNPHAPAGA